MSVRKKFREMMARQRLVLMPGAYDALSARIMEAEGFEAISAGGYAAIGSMMAQPDMGQSNMRDYADHYARICAAVEIPVYVDGDTGFGGVNNVREMVRAFEAAGVAGLFYQRPGVSQPLRLPARQAGRSGRADAGQDQGRARCAARSRLLHRRPHRCRGRRGRRCRDRALPAVHGGGRRHGQAQGVDTIEDIKRVMREVAGPHMATISQAAGPKHRSLAELEAAGVAAVSFPSVALFAAAQAVRHVLRSSSARIRSPRRSIIFCRSRITTSSLGSKRCWVARRAMTEPPKRWRTSARPNSGPSIGDARSPRGWLRREDR